MSALDETNRSAPLPSPADGESPDRAAIRARGPRREPEPAERAPHPNLPPASGRKERAACAATTEPADTIHCICIDPAHVERVWPLISHLIAAAMRKGRISAFADVERAVLGGTQLLWVAVDRQAIWAAAVTALGRHNGEKFCTIVACGGRERARWLPLKAELEAFAKAEGCAAIRIHGRRGWAREFPDYRLTRILLEKDLT